LIRRPKQESDEEAVEREILAQLRSAVAEGEADIAAGHFTVLDSDKDIEAFFANL
jgi:hypothetical protein